MTTVHPSGNGSGASAPAALNLSRLSTPEIPPPVHQGKSGSYPMAPAQLQTILAHLVATGYHHDGKRAARPQPAYFLHFRVLGLAAEKGADQNLAASQASAAENVAVIRDRNSRLTVLCQRHQKLFVSMPKVLFNTSAHGGGTTCRFCEREAGLGHAFQTVGELARQMQAREDFDFVLDGDALPAHLRDPDTILLRKDRLPLVCKRCRLGSAEPCGRQVMHAVNNIVTALNGDARHITCQGACDSMNKGKSQRMTASEVRDRLLQARQGCWTLQGDPGSYTSTADLRQALPHGGPGDVRAPWATILELLQACPARPSAPGGTPAAAQRSIQQPEELKHATFKAVTPQAAYLAGVLASDGCISLRGEIKLELKAIDEPVLLALLDFMGCDRALRYRTMKSVAGRGVYASLSVRSAPMIADLWRHYGIGPRKTHTLQPPATLPREAAVAFLSGLLEGDGCIRVVAKRRELVIHLACASKEMVEWYWHTVQVLTGLAMPAPSLLKKRKSNNWAVTVTGGKARVLGRVLLAFEGQMTRKWSVLREYLGDGGQA